MSQTQAPVRNRRLCSRRPPKGKARVTCRKGSSELGHNLAVSLLDLSESGVRLVLSAELPPGQEVSLSLEGHEYSRPIKVLARVVWSLPTAESHFCAGLRFEKRLKYGDVVRLS